MAFSDEGDCTTIEARRLHIAGSTIPSSTSDAKDSRRLVHRKGAHVKETRSSHLLSMKLRTSGNMGECQSTEVHIQIVYQLLHNLLFKLDQQRLNHNYGHDNHDDTSHLRERQTAGFGHDLVVDQVTEIVDLHDSMTMIGGENSDSSGFSSLDEQYHSGLSKAVQDQLRLFVVRIAQMYHTKNPFHCFEHASHVTCSAYQLLRHVVSKDIPESPVEGNIMADPWSELPFVSKEFIKQGTTGLCSDALAHFAIIFSALIHDVDHCGIPNAQLAKEKPAVAAKYQNRSLAEQTSVNLAWELLCQEEFQSLRECIFPTRKDNFRFKSIVINVVMSTDICDATLREFRELKWEKAFGNQSMHQTMEARVKPSKEERKRKATVLMDLIMMASDISHTMQPFEVYCEWNERLFREMMFAYREGRSEKDPSGGWSKGELFFYDKHIIPLAQRLQDSGMFGPAADAMLANARNNRDLWQQRCDEILAGMLERLDVDPSKVFPSINMPAEETPQAVSLLGGFLSRCCRGALPKYLQSNNGFDPEEYYEGDEEEGLLEYKKRTFSGEDDTVAETDEDEVLDPADLDEDGTIVRSSWTSLYLRSRPKKS